MEITRICFLFLLIFPVILKAYQESTHGRLLMPTNVIEQEFTRSLSPDDRDRIELLFSTFICKDPFAYVLFGEKPVALSGGFRRSSWENVLLNHDFNVLFWKRWETWKSCSLGLQFPNFLLLEENFSAVPNIRFVILINKKLFIETIEIHSKRFREITGKTMNPVKLLMELEEKKTTLQQAIHFNEELLGILLGFGEINASLYSRRQLLEGLLMIPLALHKSPSEGFLSVEDEVSFLNEQLQFSSNEDHFLFNVCPVEFVADKKAAETYVLCQKYLKARYRLCEIYRDGSYFDVSLRQLMTP